jgi:hypothetical protein
MVIHLILFGFYLKISFDFGLGEILLNGIQEGTTLIKDIFIKGFK